MLRTPNDNNDPMRNLLRAYAIAPNYLKQAGPAMLLALVHVILGFLRLESRSSWQRYDLPTLWHDI